MSDSTIDDAIRLLEIGKGNVDRLKKIIETFETRSLIAIQDRKYVEALVQQYLTPRHRIKIKKIDPIKKQQFSTPRTLKSTKPEFDFEKDDNESDTIINLKKSEPDTTVKKECSQCGYLNFGGNNFCNKCGSRISQTEEITIDSDTPDQIKNESAFEKYEREYLERQFSKKDEVGVSENENRVIEYIEAKPTSHKKTNKKLIGIGISIAAIIIIASGAALVSNDANLFSNTDIVERIVCDKNPLLVSTTKIPNFPDPEKDLQYYLDRYNNEPNYKDWFDRNFPDQTVREVVC